MQPLGKGGEDPSSLEARAGAFLGDARLAPGLTDLQIGAIERRLLDRGYARRSFRLWPALTASAVLLATGSAIALVGGWRPLLPCFEPSASPPPLRPVETRPAGRATPSANPPLIPRESPPSPLLAPTPETRPSVAGRRLPRQEPATSLTAPTTSPTSPQPDGIAVTSSVSAEARSLADALARWHRDGNAEMALGLLTAHERRFEHGALAVESKVARAKILLALERHAQALVVLDSLSLASLPRADELQIIRGELRAEAGRCREAKADISQVMVDKTPDDLTRRAARVLAKCP